MSYRAQISWAGERLYFLTKQSLMKMKKSPSASFCFDLVKEGNRKIFKVACHKEGKIKSLLFLEKRKMEIFWYKWALLGFCPNICASEAICEVEKVSGLMNLISSPRFPLHIESLISLVKLKTQVPSRAKSSLGGRGERLFSVSWKMFALQGNVLLESEPRSLEMADQGI